MLNGKEVYRSIEVTDDVQTSSLGIIDQLRLIAANISNDDAAELERNEKVSTDKLRKIASLRNFIDTALQRMQDLGENSVTMKLSSVYKPYFDEVFNNRDSYGKYYNFWIEKKNLSPNINHYVIVKISRKAS
jgi:hypothetical protein